MARNEIPRSVRASLYIDGKPAENSIKSVEQVTRRLRRELNGLEVGTADWNAKMKQVQANTRYMSELRREINGTTGAMSFLKTEIGKFGAIAAGYLGFQFVTSQFHNIIQANAQLSDSLADVRKTTNMTEEQVRDLNSELRKINTRTPRRELLDLAYAAGKLGITAKQDVLEFVAAADQIVVALGRDMGGAEEAVTAIGKLTDIFKLKETYGIEQSMLRVGSVLNELGMAGTATEQYMVNFTRRLAGIAPTANISAQSVMAIGAVMDELGQPVEASATAIGQFIVRLGRDIPKYAKIAGMSVKAFSDLLKKDGAEALMAVLKNSMSAGGGVEALAQNMGMIEVAGARGIAALGVLSNNTELYEQRLTRANKAFEEGTSVTEEFAIKNENLAAQVDKLGKEFNRLVSSSKIIDFFSKIIDGTMATVSWLNRNITLIGTLIKVLAVAGTAWASYRIAVALVNSAMVQQLLLGKSDVLLKTLQTKAGYALAAMKAVLTGNITRANAAMRALNLTMSLNPIGAVVALVAAAAAGFLLLRQNISAVQKAQDDVNRTNRQAEEDTKAQRLQMEQYTKTLADENAHRSRKLTAIKALRDMMPDVLKDYSDEEIMAGKAANAIKGHADALLYQAQIRAKAANLDSIVAENLKYNTKREEEGFWAGVGRFIVGDANYDYFTGLDRQSFEDRITRQNLALQDLMKTTEEYNSRFAEGPTGSTPEGPTPTGLDPDRDKKAADEIKKQQASLAKFLRKNAQELYLNTLNKEQRELQAIWNKYDEKRKLAHGDQAMLRELERQEAAEVAKFVEKQGNESEKAAMELASKQAEAWEQIYEAGLSAREKEFHDLQQHYERLYRLAEQYGIDKSALVEKQAIDEAEIRRRHEEQDNAARLEREAQWRDAVIDSAAEIANAIGNISRNNRQAEYDERIATLERQRTAELSNENLTERQRKAITDKYDKQIKEEKRKAFLADRKAAIGQAIINGLVGAVKLWVNPGFPAAIPLAVLLAAQTAANVASIGSQKPPAYAGGGMTDVDPEGYVSQSTIYRRSASGRPFMAGEAGREWIAPAWMVQDPRYANIVNTLESIRAQKRGGTPISAGSSNSGLAGSGGEGRHNDTALIAAIHALREDVKSANNKKVVFDYHGFEEFQKDIEFARRAQSG